MKAEKKIKHIYGLTIKEGRKIEWKIFVKFYYRE
jgi:hypothetical protein